MLMLFACSLKYSCIMHNVMTREINLFPKDWEEASLIWFPKCTRQPFAVFSLSPQTRSSPQPFRPPPSVHLLQMFFTPTAGLSPCRLSSACPADDVFLAPENFQDCYKQCLRGQRIVPSKTTTKLGRSCKNPDGWLAHMKTLWCFSLLFSPLY